MIFSELARSHEGTKGAEETFVSSWLRASHTMLGVL
jgi:hypothetical protein